jgi:hypothetical protein
MDPIFYYSSPEKKLISNIESKTDDSSEYSSSDSYSENSNSENHNSDSETDSISSSTSFSSDYQEYVNLFVKQEKYYTNTEKQIEQDKPEKSSRFFGLSNLIGLISNKSNNAFINSLFLWSNTVQTINNVLQFQNIFFENIPININNEWTFIKDDNLTKSLICNSNGWYSITYIINISNNSSFISNFASLLTKNNISIDGSTSIIELTHLNNIYSITRNISTFIKKDDIINLMFWSSDTNIKIGNNIIQLDSLPNDYKIIDTTVSLSINKIN